MKTPPTRLREGIDGPPRLVRSINEILAYTVATAFTGALGGLVRQTTRGTRLKTVEQAVVAAGLGESQRMLVDSIHADYLECTGPNGVVQVAKPWRLRRTPFDGQTISFTDEQGRDYSALYTYDGFVRRTVSIVSAGFDTFSEAQVVIPRIKIEFDYIDVFTSSNGTGVAEAPDLIDLNTDGRAWARERQ